MSCAVLIDSVVDKVVEIVSDVLVVVNDLVTRRDNDVILAPLVATFRLLHVAGDVAPGTHCADHGLQLGQGLGQHGGQGHVQGQGHERNDSLVHHHAVTSSLQCR